MLIRLPALAATLFLLPGPAAAEAPGPVYKDRERFERPMIRPGPALRPGSASDGFPAHPLVGGPGYVGSDYGLGKPAFTGLGTRPDWGYGD
ncbi:MAG: hypothetical protein JO048_01695 [Methylobacteriaceae bacterium]|nr:hypothetical protein [Methylobacteriaceae bacterium]